MTVSSTISVFCRDGVFRTVYCHLHGEPARNGRILHTHYATGQQAEALVEHGDIRCLGPRCDKPAGHTLQNPVDGVTAYYGRDSGFRMDSEAREYRSFREAIATESTEEVRFHYVFIDGYWKVMYRTPEGWKMKALALALRRCPE
ncbi:post-segregation killing protein PndC [Escherichia coli]|uniref:post-segregation killing protein PndC n=1 Tax=Escherichia coli TaxID=562 RepID=UPI000A00E86E|nr:post-segregation killing protein PndC [Escherichia coli]EBY2157813.1 post-segregation killing protein PndC [Salmonella enterica subsp. enterica serovar Coeln]EEU9423075.1 post-segregation killing protein PndC [Escherichia coli]EEU9480492.1 post-segregation killing protein PndC [Escherichia coli]EEW1561469.1 post-segregation killing protein PndC [Escherichia coli]EEW2132584.1 post-segregation killing protein PndC [Escherichia coli]